MHNYQPFEMRDEAKKIAFVTERRFANLVVCGPNGPIAAHIPMIIHCNETGDLELEGHVARSNPIAKMTKNVDALAIFNGPDAYVAAGFYPSKKLHGKVAPTWNYLAVHCSGQMDFFSGENELVDHLTHLTDFMETDETTPWAVNDAPDGFTDKLVKAIVGLRMSVKSIEGIAKLNQNSSPSDRSGVIAGLQERGIGHEQRIVDEMVKLKDRVS